MIKNLYQFREILRQQGVYFSFMGPMSQTLMEGLSTILRQKLKLEEASTPTIKNVFAVVIEQAQNIIYYSAERVSIGEESGAHEEYPVGAIVIGFDGEHYFVVSGNMIQKSKVEILKERLTPLQTMTKEELKKLFKESRRKGREPGSDSKGAGLGFIDMARKASAPIQFDFQDIDENMSFFSLMTLI